MDFFCPQKPLLWKLDGSGRLPQCDVCLGGNGDRRERKNSTLSPLLNRSVLNAGWKAHRKTIHCICEWLIFTIISVFLNVEIEREHGDANHQPRPNVWNKSWHLCRLPHNLDGFSIQSQIPQTRRVDTRESWLQKTKGCLPSCPWCLMFSENPPRHIMRQSISRFCLHYMFCFVLLLLSWSKTCSSKFVQK